MAGVKCQLYGHYRMIMQATMSFLIICQLFAGWWLYVCMCLRVRGHIRNR